MKYCSKCGNELVDEAVVCTKCGCVVESNKSNSMVNISKIFMIIGCVANALIGVISGITNSILLYDEVSFIFILIGLITCAWTIPMTISYFKKLENHETISIGFKVCSLIFVSTVAGILMLCDKEQ